MASRIDTQDKLQRLADLSLNDQTRESMIKQPIINLAINLAIKLANNQAAKA